MKCILTINSEQFYFSKKAGVGLFLIMIIGLYALSLDKNNDQWFSIVGSILLLLYIAPAYLTWNRSVIKYSLKHSFDLKFILFLHLVLCVCNVAFRIDQKSSAMHCIVLGLRFLFGLCLTLSTFSLEAVPWPHRFKQILLIFQVLIWARNFLNNLYNRNMDAAPKTGVEMHIDSLDVTISFRDIILMCYFNQSVFWFKKLVQTTKYPNCILIATYPRMIWLDETMRQQTLSNIGRRRAATMSLDIYKQSISQRTDIFLFDDDGIAKKLFSLETATRIHQLHSSKWNLAGIAIVICAMFAILFGTHILAIISETCCIAILVVGPFTFNTEMMKVYVKSFDYWYKWFNWTLYLCAYSVWTNHQHDMNGTAWTEFALRNLVITITIFYIFSIDAYHVPERKKKRALLILILTAAYFYVCIVWQLYFQNPAKDWEDLEIQIPLMQVEVSLRGMMMSSLGNLIIFMIKQLALMVAHPGAADFGLYPEIKWIGDEREDHPDPILEES